MVAIHAVRRAPRENSVGDLMRELKRNVASYRQQVAEY